MLKEHVIMKRDAITQSGRKEGSKRKILYVL